MLAETSYYYIPKFITRNVLYIIAWSQKQKLIQQAFIYILTVKIL